MGVERHANPKTFQAEAAAASEVIELGAYFSNEVGDYCTSHTCLHSVFGITRDKFIKYIKLILT